ncbi:hypothetical protein DSO57_1031589 [Entomophthora muscae]|uniref:Uncharacterized protein n=1 Tax=Entomophthora muscae TaxID=34485 RepID=A0ACC2TM94_9FUNG|nr:hypothetical protein DSO57_1031589 [Entomophthora muscae]
MHSFLGSPFWTPFKKLFFKPTPGCKHVFDDLSVKLVQEICPLGVDQAKWKPKLSWDDIETTQSKIDSLKLEEDLPRIKLSPKDFHSLLKGSANSEVSSRDRLQPPAQDTDIVLLDVRNYYESALGNFEGAVCPPIRNFKSLPNYLRKNLSLFSKKTLVTYCTGGIRCEKATAYIRDFIQPELQSKPDLEPINAVYMLEGGIHNYLEWFQASKSPEEECLFQGRNYIFDARQSTSLSDYSIHSTPTPEKQASKSCITKCGFCSAPAAHLYKCTSQHCHKLIVRCAPLNAQDAPVKPSNCYLSLPSCCLDCLNSVKTKTKKVGLCECELKRVQALETVQASS